MASDPKVTAALQHLACPSPELLRQWADEPAENRMVPLHPDTIRSIADMLDIANNAMDVVNSAVFANIIVPGSSDYWVIRNAYAAWVRLWRNMRIR